MEHRGDKPDRWRLVRVIFSELQSQLERTAIPGCIVRSEDDSIPEHDVVVLGSTTDPGGRVVLQALEVTHEALARGCGHVYSLDTTTEQGRTANEEKKTLY